MHVCVVDGQTINYGNHSVSDFLVRYGFVPKGQVRSVNMEVVPWPLRGISTQPSLGQVASQPHTDIERELHRKLLEHRHHDQCQHGGETKAKHDGRRHAFKKRISQ